MTISSILIILVSGLAGCVTTPDVDYALLQSDKNSICSQKRREFTVIASTKIPKGLRVDEVSAAQDAVTASIENVNSNFIEVLAGGFFERADTGEVSLRDTQADFTQLMRLDWVGGNTFVYWHKNTVSRHTNEENPYIISLRTPQHNYTIPLQGGCDGFYEAFFIGSGFSTTNCATLHPIYINEGYSQTKNRALDMLGFPKTGIFAFIAKSRFNLGAFFNTHYFSMSKDDRQKIGLPTSESIDVIDINQIGLNSNEILNALVLKADKVSKKIEGDWVTSRHIINLTDICKYARPNTDFLAD
ncbi:MAG: hypothetical protein NTV34_02355 [Proteobacteria bacterium]|nr:hypothetical protein [Pseudomonadota bacterium]